MSREILVPLAVAGLWIAFAAVSVGLALSGGRGPWLRAKLRLGGLLLAMTAVSCDRCGPEPMCYDVGSDSNHDSDADTDADTDTDVDGDRAR